MPKGALLLFDVDGTILDTGGAGAPCLINAFQETLSLNIVFDRDSYRGETDHLIVKSILENANLSSKENIECVIDNYEKNIFSYLQKGKVSLLEGVNSLFDFLYKEGKYTPVLATGNTTKGLRAKLVTSGFKYPDIEAFTSRIEDLKRSDILARAVANFPNQDDYFVIGDTKRDALAASELGLNFIAVTNNHFSQYQAIASNAVKLMPHPWKENALEGLSN